MFFSPIFIQQIKKYNMFYSTVRLLRTPRQFCCSEAVGSAFKLVGLSVYGLAAQYLGDFLSNQEAPTFSSPNTELPPSLVSLISCSFSSDVAAIRVSVSDSGVPGLWLKCKHLVGYQQKAPAPIVGSVFFIGADKNTLRANPKCRGRWR